MGRLVFMVGLFKEVDWRDVKSYAASGGNEWN